jgi:glycine C-acetyltransferase
MFMFGSNNYLGATALAKAKQKSIEVTQKFGIGSGGVPLLSGTTIYQNRLENLIAKMKGMDDAILFSSGFTANVGVLVGLMRPNNLIIHDKLNHASLVDGTIMSGAKMLRYRHSDIQSLEKLLKENHVKYPNGILVITDGGFSMDGDIANLPAIIKVVQKYDALLLIDDAHATGVIGKKGAGTLSYYNITNKDNIIVTGTLSKAIGSVGGFITGEQKIIDYLRIFARSNMYSTALPPGVCASAIEVINYINKSNVVDALKEKSEYLRNSLSSVGFNILNTKTAIIPIIVGDEIKLTQMSKDFYEKDIFMNYIFPPVVSSKLSRIRISVMATHTKDDLDYLINSIIEIGKQYSII